ncbi:glycosyltransferase family 2 protein [Paenibacillus sp. NRS-1760]|uniref:glycosyltransferase family 2 protein n=1 Tax=Paenibacillus sp. NRS-1760 TaxID=3233902 RepID=UPI003D2E76AC
MQVSIVTTLYKSEKYLEEFYTRIKNTLKSMNLTHEIIMVNDGSPDNSLDIATKIQNIDTSVKVIDLSKNFGHHKAILTGLSYVSGNIVFLIDCDLEEEPELLSQFYKEWIENEEVYDVMYGIQENRSGTFYRRIAGAMFYKLFNYLSDVQISENICTVRLMTKRYVDSLLGFKDKNVFLAALFEKTGFKQKSIRINKNYKGSSSYNTFKKIALMTDAITSFSSKPLLVIMMTGLMISSISFLYAFFLIVRKIFNISMISGWTSLMVSVWFLSGIILFSIGTLGIYISKIYTETKDRPITVIKKIYEYEDGEF